jgi:TRAP-type C4-dicarboxylate transport system substrate-binding protein
VTKLPRDLRYDFRKLRKEGTYKRLIEKFDRASSFGDYVLERGKLVRKLTPLLIAIALAVFLLVGCSQPASTPASTQTTTSTTTTTATATSTSMTTTTVTTTTTAPATIELIYADWNPSGAPVTQSYVDWANRIEQDTGGRVKITNYFAGSLAGNTEVFRACQTGMADIVSYVVGSNPGLLPLNEGGLLPFIGWPDSATATKAYRELLQTTPELLGEFQGLKVMVGGARQMPGFQLHMTKKDALLPADLKGTKIIASGQLGKLVEAAGGAPVSLGALDWYTSLERGLAEGHFIFFAAADAFGLLELEKYHTMFGDGGSNASPYLQLMNLDTWNSLPPDIQKIIEDEATNLGDYQLGMDIQEEQSKIDKAKSTGTVTYITAEQLQAWKDLAKPIQDAWIADTASKGLPGQAIYDKIQQLIAKYSK